MEHVSVISQWVVMNIEAVLLVLSILILGMLAIFIRINVKLSRMVKKYSELMQGDMEGKDLEKILFEHLEQVARMRAKVDSLSEQCYKLAMTTEHCLQKVGVVRFNAFPDTGSNLSFSVALLDAKDDGIVISSLFGREEVRTYGKAIINGKSQYLLSEEEQEALQIAQRKK